MPASAALVGLAMQFCPWQPEALPHVVVLPDPAYNELEEGAGLEDTRGVLLRYFRLIILRESTANERLLCHEWRHIVEGSWH